jgi:hypothetical protein
MTYDLDDEDFGLDIEESFKNEVALESVFHRSFKQAFGFWMGSFFALVLISILLMFTAYFAVESGYITWEELLFID